MARRSKRSDTAPELPRVVEEVGRTEKGERIVAVTAKVRLSTEDRLRKGEQVEAATVELERLQAEKSTTTASFGKLVKEQAKVVRDLRNAFRTATEERPVSCREVLDYAAGKVYLRHVETDELMDQRAMTVDERQLPLTMAASGLPQDEPPQQEPSDAAYPAPAEAPAAAGGEPYDFHEPEPRATPEAAEALATDVRGQVKADRKRRGHRTDDPVDADAGSV